MSRSRPIFVLLITILAAACSGATPSTSSGGAPPGSTGSGSGGSSGSSGSSGQSAIDACTLLTPDEIQSATSLTVTGKGEPSLAGGKECKWKLAPGKNAEGVAFDRFVDISMFGKSYFQGATAVSPGPETVSGIADQAVYVSGVLVALKGDRSFALSVFLHETGNGTSETDTKEHDAAVALGKQAAPRF
jgi:hypothetical protein